MSETSLRVKLLDVTSRAVALIYAACRQCYSSRSAGALLEDPQADGARQAAFIRKVVASGHESPLEHAKFTFGIEGVSRALTHQLVRHRIASFSQQSQRYVRESAFDYVVPPSIARDPGLKAEFVRTMEHIQERYNSLVDKFKACGREGERAFEDARFVLPQAAETKIVVTMNARELLHFFRHRCCARAQWEIKRLAGEMLRLARRELPEVFEGAGAKCVDLRYCPEGARFSCGRYPLKEDAVLKRRRRKK
ncbi:MAG: FAD-dependent thymidylate synthase [Deltaproteobacteria bacterium]